MTTTKDVKVENHWGIWVDSETPITGVCCNHDIEWLHEEICKGINLDYETWVKENNPTEEEMEYYESDCDTYLIGSWTQDDKGLYIPDKTGEYAAIVGETYTQVVWSIKTERKALCSPYYLGQGDMDTPGEFLTYVMPD